MHLRYLLDDDPPFGIAAGTSYALLQGKPETERTQARGYVLSLGGEIGYSAGSERPNWAMESKTLTLHAIGGAHLVKRVTVFAGWRELGGLIHLRLASDRGEAVDRLVMRSSGPLFGIGYAGRFVGISYQVWPVVIGGLRPLVPLQMASFFFQI